MAVLESKEVVESLLDQMFSDKQGSALYNGLDVMTELVKRNVLDKYDSSSLFCFFSLSHFCSLDTTMRPSWRTVRMRLEL